MKKFGLIGKQLSHSFSKSFFHKKFNEENIDATYENYELSDLKNLRFLIEKNQICGLNVTIPYKEEVINYMFGCTGETFPQCFILCSDTDRAGVKMTFTHHNTA